MLPHKVLAFFSSCLVASLCAAPVAAQPFPSKPVRMLIGSAAGSTPDVFSRLIGQKMSETFGAPVLVDNRPGASGTLASEAVAKAAPDGYTLLFTDNSAWAINPHLFSRLPYDPLKDLAPVTQAGLLPLFLVVHPSVPAATLAEFIAHVKRNPGKLHYGSAGNGSIHHLTAELFKSMAGVDVVHVPYKGAAQIGTALMAGEAQLAFMGYTGAAQGIAQGRIKVLGVANEQRSPSHAAIPTLNEGGVPGFEMAATVGLLAPAGTPPDVIGRLNSAVAAALVQPEVSARLTSLGINPVSSTPEQFGRRIKLEYEKFGRLVKQSGVRVD